MTGNEAESDEQRVLTLVATARGLKRVGRLTEALHALDRALNILPDNVEALVERAGVLADLNRSSQARADAERALRLSPGHAMALNNRGIARAQLGRPDAALEDFDAALVQAPGLLAALSNKSATLAELGRQDEALAAIEEAIRVDPARPQAYYSLLRQRSLRPGEPHLAVMEQMASEPDSFTREENIRLAFALGKAYAGLNDYRRSFEAYARGASRKRAAEPYDEARWLGVLRSTAATFSREALAKYAGAGDSSRLPIFVLGMPRSGTTLVEQILASHPKVAGLGEIETIFPIMAQFADDQGVGRTPGDLLRIDRESLRRLGAAYLRTVKPLAGKASRAADKSIRNFAVAGLAHMALPNARFVHVRRNALDACWSCFSHLFMGNHPYAYDLAELGRYYRAYDRLMDHWRAVLPPRVFLEVRYEDLVADLEGQSRRMLAHCGMEWDPAVLDFHKTERPVRTASVMQVRQPIYASSIGRWRNYEPWLGPLIEALGPDLADT